MTDAISILSNEMIPAVEAEMKDLLRFGRSGSDTFFGMMHYHLGWIDENLDPVITNGGKRIRPLLCLLTCAAAGGDWRQAVPAAASIEIIHNFSLVHDDIQDASPTRRGRKTLWKLWGIKQAINAGDALFALAHTAMERSTAVGVSDSITLKAVRMLDETCLLLTTGQYMDMDFEEREDVSVEDYLSMIGGKTAALLSLSTESGAMIAGVSAEIQAHYAAFGRDLGLAFQIRDDILGIWGDETVIGKSAVTDIETRKKSLPVLHGLANSEDLRILYQETKADQDFVDQAVHLLETSGSHEFATEHEKQYAASAVAHLEAADPKEPAGEALLQLTGRLLGRRF